MNKLYSCGLIEFFNVINQILDSIAARFQGHVSRPSTMEENAIAWRARSCAGIPGVSEMTIAVP